MQRIPTIANYFDEPIVLSEDERLRHLYVLGRTGMGKSTLGYNLALSDMLKVDVNGRPAPVIVIDPHGGLADDLLDSIPPWRTDDVICLDAGDPVYAVGFNPLVGVGVAERDRAMVNLTQAFRSHFGEETWSERMEWFMLNSVRALLDYETATLVDLPRMSFDSAFRARVTARLTNPINQTFWFEEFPAYGAKYDIEAAAPINNRVGKSIMSSWLRGIVGQVVPKLNMASAIEQHQIIIIKLAKGIIGEEPANLLGSLCVAALWQALLERQRVPPAQRHTVFAHIDEFHDLGTSIFSQMFSSGRQYGLALSVAHQQSKQVDPKVRSDILANTSTTIAFQLGIEDAELLATMYDPLPAAELVNQGIGKAWIRRALYLTHAPINTWPMQPAFTGRRAKVMQASNERAARLRSAIEASFLRENISGDRSGRADVPKPKSPAHRQSRSKNADRTGPAV